MLTKTKISGILWTWYAWQGYLIKSDQPLTPQNSVRMLCLPGQGQLSTDITALDQVVPANLFNSGHLPELTTSGKFITYIVPEFPHWVNTTDVQAWVDSILPTLNLPLGKLGMYGLSLGGLGMGYFNQAKSGTHFDFAFFNDGFMSPFAAADIANMVKNVDALCFVSNVGDTTVPEIPNSKNVYSLIKEGFPNFQATFVELPGSSHDTWDPSFNPANTGPDSFFVYLEAQTKGAVTIPVTPPVIPSPPIPSGKGIYLNIGAVSNLPNIDSGNNVWNQIFSFAPAAPIALVDVSGKATPVTMQITESNDALGAPTFMFSTGPKTAIGTVPAWVTKENAGINLETKLKFSGAFKGAVEFWGTRPDTSPRVIKIDGNIGYDAATTVKESDAVFFPYADGHEFVIKSSNDFWSCITLIRLIPATTPPVLSKQLYTDGTTGMNIPGKTVKYQTFDNDTWI